MEDLRARRLTSFLTLPPPEKWSQRLALARSLLEGTHVVAFERAPEFFAEFQDLIGGNIFAPESVDEEAPDLVDAVAARLISPIPDLAAIMAAMLLQPSSRWRLAIDARQLPVWFMASYVSWRIVPPNAIEEIGEAARYERYIHETLHELHDLFVSDGLEADSRLALGNVIYNRWNLIQLYFNESTNIERMLLKSNIVERNILRNNSPAAWVFPDRDPNQKLRIAFYSGRQYLSPEGCFLLSHVENFPRDRCELILLYDKNTSDPFQDYCFVQFDSVVLLKESWGENISYIRQLNLDVLAFANNATAISNHLTFALAYRLARVQMVLSASPMTTGYTQADVFLSSAQSEVPGPLRDRYSEEVHTMPGMLNYYAFQHDASKITMRFTREKLGISENTILFLSMANYYKCMPELVESWARILKAVPNSVLMVMPFGAAWGNYEIKTILRNFTKRVFEQDISPDRLLIHPPVPTRADVLSITKLADIYLDSYPFSGACSLLDPLLGHVPVVVREGTTFRSRFAGTMLRFIGLGDLVTESQKDYEAAAIRLAGDAKSRADIKRRIETAFANGVPFFDVHTMPRHVEQACVDVMAEYEARKKALRTMSIDALKQAISSIVQQLVKTNCPFWSELNRVELVRILAMLTSTASGAHALHFNLSPLATVALEKLGWALSSFENFSGMEKVDLAYFLLPPEENFSLEIMRLLQPRLIIVETRPITGRQTYLSKTAQMHENGYDCMIISGARNLNIPFEEIDYHATGIHFDFPDATANFAMIVFFRRDDTLLLAGLLEILDRFNHGRDRSWMRLVPEGQREAAIALPESQLPAQGSFSPVT